MDICIYLYSYFTKSLTFGSSVGDGVSQFRYLDEGAPTDGEFPEGRELGYTQKLDRQYIAKLEIKPIENHGFKKFGKAK